MHTSIEIKIILTFALVALITVWIYRPAPQDEAMTIEQINVQSEEIDALIAEIERELNSQKQNFDQRGNSR